MSDILDEKMTERIGSDYFFPNRHSDGTYYGISLEEWRSLRKTQKKKKRKRFGKMQKNSLDCCKVATIPLGWYSLSSAQAYDLYGTPQKKETPMNTSNYITVTGPEVLSDAMKQREYLKRELHNIRDDKNSDALKTFGLNELFRPMTPSALVDYITKGKFILSDESKDRETYDPLDYFTWKDPAVTKDQTGYNAWRTKLDAAYTTAQRQIIIQDPTDGLATLTAFEASIIQ